MTWLIPAIIATLCGSAILCGLYLYLYIVERRPYLGVWAIAWLASVSRYAFNVMGGVENSSPAILIGNYSSALINGVLLWMGACLFLGNGIRRRWLVGLTASVVIIALAAGLGAPRDLIAFSTFLAVGGIFIWTGYLLLRQRAHWNRWVQVAGVAFILWGIHKWEYILFHSIPELAPWRLLLTSSLELVVAVAFLLSHFERLRADFFHSEQLYRLLAENAVDVIYRQVFRPAYRFEYISPAIKALTGYSSEELMTQPRLVEALVHPDDRQSINAAELATTQSERTYPLRLRRRDGSVVWVEDRQRILRNAAGEAIASEGILRDISDRRSSEEALIESEAKYATLVEHAQDGVMITVARQCVFANPAMERLSGFTRAELLGKNFLELAVPEERAPALARSALRAQGLRLDKPQMTELLRKDGTRRSIEVSISAIAYRGQPAFMGIVRDITERKRLEMESARAQKLESLGLLAGGIAHDFNNLLAGILGNLSLALFDTQGDPTVQSLLQEAQNAAGRAKDLTQQLLTFAKGGAPQRETFALASVIQQTVAFALRGSPSRATFALSEDLKNVHADKGQIGQVLQNLTINADQAMPGGGTLRVWANNRLFPDDVRGQLPAGTYVEIGLQDEGIGIPADYLPRIFDPYFTTKQRGSGLGLATSYSIIKNHGGHIAVESEPGEGTTFHVYLPASSEETVGSTPQAAIGVQAGRGRVLVMDDEDPVRRVVCRMLARLGYAVNEASEGGAALELYQRARDAGAPFDLVLADLTVPGGMGGKEMTRRLLEMDPTVRVIVSSGYSTDPIMADYRSYGFCGVISKPFVLEDLSQALSQAIGAPPAMPGL